MDYDNIASDFDAYTLDAVTDIELGYKYIIHLLGSRSRGKLLDYGCGTGKCSRFLKNHGAQVVGMDISRKEIAIAKAYNDGIDYCVMNTQTFKEVSSDFDGVVLGFVLCTIPSMGKIVDVLKHCRSKLKPNGKLVILNGNMERSHGKEFVSFTIQELHDPKSGDPVRVRLGKQRSLEVCDYYWTRADYENMLEQAGFALDEVLEPVAVEGAEWKDERKFPPFHLMSASPANT